MAVDISKVQECELQAPSLWHVLMRTSASHDVGFTRIVEGQTETPIDWPQFKRLLAGHGHEFLVARREIDGRTVPAEGWEEEASKCVRGRELLDPWLSLVPVADDEGENEENIGARPFRELVELGIVKVEEVEGVGFIAYFTDAPSISTTLPHCANAEDELARLRDVVNALASDKTEQGLFLLEIDAKTPFLTAAKAVEEKLAKASKAKAEKPAKPRKAKAEKAKAD